MDPDASLSPLVARVAAAKQVLLRNLHTTPIATLDEYTLQDRVEMLVTLQEGSQRKATALLAERSALGYRGDFDALRFDGGVGTSLVRSAGQQNLIELSFQLISAPFPLGIREKVVRCGDS